MSTSPDPRLQRARDLYAASRLDEAERLLQDILAAQPGDLEALLLLGSIAGQAGKIEVAAGLFERARTVAPSNVEAWRGLGLVRRRQGRLAEAIAAYERALAFDADNAELHINIAVALRAAGEFERAIDHLRRAVVLQPRLGAAYLNLGNCLYDKGDLDQAGAAYVECLRINPRDVAAALGVARVFRKQKRLDMAEKTLRGAAKLMPGNPDIQATLGAAAHDQGRTTEAAEILEPLVARHPGHALGLYHLANLRRDAGQLDVAEDLYRRAIAADPGNADVALSLAEALVEVGRTSEVVPLIEDVQRRFPNDAEIRNRCALVLLDAGDLQRGWNEYSWRLRTVRHRAARFGHLPRLEALVFAGRKIVLWGDQGIGDEIIYGSFLLDLLPHASHLVCELDPRLVPLFRRGFPGLQFIAREAGSEQHPAVADATHQISLTDLGRWLRPDFGSFPRHRGYLRADGERAKRLREQIAIAPGEKLVGVSWRSRNQDVGAYKSIALHDLINHLPVGRLRLVNLQYGDVSAEIEEVARQTGRRVEVVPGLDCYQDIDGLGALVAACDAVVTVSNVTVHLAGSLGQPVALLCAQRHGKLWYWFRGRPDSPWYYSMRICRQGMDNDWSQALADAAAWIEQN